MPWNSQGGSGKGQGPWGSGNGGRNQWGGGGSQSPDLEEILRKSQDKFRNMMPKGFGSLAGIIGILGIVAVIWMATGFYRVNIGEQAVVLRFGKWVDTTTAGLQYHFPYPIEEIEKRRVDKVNRVDSGADPLEIGQAGFRKVEDQPLMLTGDENIVDTTFTVLWFIKDLGQYLFKARSPDETIKIAADSIVREIVAQTPIAEVLTKGRGGINDRARDMLQKVADEYTLGIQIQEVRLQRVDPPPSVIESFRDVQRARTDQERKVNEAQAYENNVVPIAEGEAIKLVQIAEGYKAAKIAQSEGDSQRFLSVLKEYRQAPDITRKRMYLETMQGIFKNSTKVMINSGAKNAQGVIPYLPLPELRKQAQKTENTEGTS